MIFTRRERHVLVIFILTLFAIFVSGIDQQTLNRYEYLWLIFYILPLGIYILTDPERKPNAES